MTTSAWKHKILKSLPFGNKDRISILINKRKDLGKVASILKEVCESNKSNFRLTSFDVELPGYFQDLNIKMDYSWDYLNEEDCLYIDKFFFKKLAKGWFIFRALPEDYFSEYPKNLLGKCTEYEFVISNLVLIKYIEVISKIFTIYKPTKILVVEDSPYLVNIVKLFRKRYRFKSFRINPQLKPVLNKLRTLRKAIKAFLRDSAILLLDFFVLRYILLSKKFKNRIIIDHRLYKRLTRTQLTRTQLKQKLLVCPFEKGLNTRLEMLLKGLFYLPVRVSSSFDFFLQGHRIYRRIKSWNKIKTNSDIKNAFKYKDIIFWDAIEKNISQTFLVSFPRVMANITTFQRFTQRKNVRLAVMRNDIKELERSLIGAARSLKIPTLVIQHGITGDANIDDALHVDMTAVWGKASIEWFRQFGYRNNRFTVIGNPMYDELYHRISAKHQDITKKKICQQLNLNFSKKIIAFLTSSNYLFSTSSNQGYEMGIVIKAILNILKDLADTQLIIKLHPYDDRMYIYKKIIEDSHLNADVAMVREFNTFDILESSDLVIMKYSSTGLEALILDKPLIALMPQKGVSIKVPYAEEGVAIGVRKTEELEPAIRAGLYNEKVRENLKLNRKKFVFNYAYKIDGQATKRVEELIHKLANNSKKG